MDLYRNFIPISKDWKLNKCDEIGLSFNDCCSFDYDSQVSLGQPKKYKQIIGDGNCFFRALSFNICGNEENHSYFRSIITSFILTNKNAQHKVLNGRDSKEYLHTSGMCKDKTWATEIELFYAAECLNIDIYVYSIFGSKLAWLKFPSTQIGKPNGCIYLNHTNGNHYDVVINVDPREEDNLTNSPDETCIDLDETNPEIEDVSMLNLSDMMEMMSFEESNSIAENEEETKVDKSSGSDDYTIQNEDKENVDLSSDPFDFTTQEHDVTTTYNRELHTVTNGRTKHVVTSTPKKRHKYISKHKRPYHKIVHDHDSDSSNTPSICNSSFEDALQNMKQSKRVRKEHSSLFKKALGDVHLVKRKGRKCKMHCLQDMDEAEIRQARYKFWTKCFENRVEWFLDKLCESSTKDLRLSFLVENGRRVCGSCFMLLLRMDKNFYYTHLKNAKNGKSAAGFRKGRSGGRAREAALAWIDNYAYFHADKMPDTGYLMLPYKTRKKDLYNVYVDEKTDDFQPSVCQSLFYDIWEKKFKNLKIKKTNAFSKCNTCVHLEKELEKTRNQAKRIKLKKMISVHNERQMNERRYYYGKREKARKQHHKCISIIIDGMDQSKTNLPHFTGRLLKGVDPNSFLRTHIQGVLNHGKGTFDKYVDINEYSHDSNLVLNILLRTIHKSISKEGRLPEVLYLQADNCFRENKNKYVLGFCELLVRLDIFSEVNLSFLQVGHTHEDIDARFSRLADILRRNEAETMPKLLTLLNGAIQVQGLFDIKAWITPYLKSIKHHSKPLHFRFNKSTLSESGIVIGYKSNSKRPWEELDQTLLIEIPTGHPDILLPPNFNKIDTKNIKENVTKQKYNMTGGERQYQWWQRFLSEIDRIKSSSEALEEYASKDAHWYLPALVGIQTRKGAREPEAAIDDHLLEMLDKELDVHKVVITNAKKVKSTKK